jgi:hypothetical protein
LTNQAITTCPAVGADARGRNTRRQQRGGEGERRGAAYEAPELGMGLLERAQPGQPTGVEQLGRNGEYRQVEQAGKAKRNDQVEALEADHSGALPVVAARHSPLGERGLKVDRVRHHGGADDPGRDVERAGAAHAGDQPTQRAAG